MSVEQTNYYNMKYFVLVVLFAVAALSVPIDDDDEAIVDVVQDNEGYYKYTLTSKNITRVEERFHDGTVKGSYSYIDDDGVRQTVEYTAGPQGFAAAGSTIPVDLPEVEEARKQHEIISEKVRSYLPPLNEDGLVDEVSEVPLSKEEFLAAIGKALYPELLVSVPDTPEIAELKANILDQYKTALDH